MALQVPAHRHCDICGKVVAVGDRWCSSECEEKHDEAQNFKKKQALKTVLLVVALFLLMQLILNFGLFGQGG